MNVQCRDIRPLLSAYMDNELTAEEVRTVQAHVATCQECAAVLAEYREMRTLVRALPQPTPPVALRGSVFGKATPAYRQRAFLWDLGQRGLTYGAVAVVLVALIVTTSLLFRNGGNGGVLGALDKTAPAIISHEPNPETDYWGLNRPVRIGFTEPMDEASVLAALRIATLPSSGTDERARLLATARWEGTILVLGEGDIFRADTLYSIEFDTTIARDRAGNSLRAPNPTAYRFRTIDTIAAAAQSTPGPLPTAAPTRTISIVTEASPSTNPSAFSAPAAPTPTATTRPNPIVPGVPTATTAPPVPTNAPASISVAPQPSQPSSAPRPAPTATPTVPRPTATLEPPQPTATAVPPTSTIAPTVAPTVPPTVAPTPTTVPPTPTAAPPMPTATPKLPFPIVGGFGQLYERNGDVRAHLGLPTANEVRVGGAYLVFENGLMIWRADTKTIYVLFNDQSAWYAFSDSWAEGMDVGGGAGPAAGQFKPMRNFGKVWREQPDVQKRLGYALSADEIGTNLIVQQFERGLLLWSNATGKPLIYALYQNNLYERYQDPGEAAGKVDAGS